MKVKNDMNQIRINVTRNMEIAAAKVEATKGRIAGEISDISKDLHGFRYRCDWQRMTVTELRNMRNDFQQRLEEDINRERDDKRARVAAVRVAMTPSPAFTIGDFITAGL